MRGSRARRQSPMRSVVAKVREVRASESHAANELDVEHNLTKRRRFHGAGAGGELCANDFATADLTDDVHAAHCRGRTLGTSHPVEVPWPKRKPRRKRGLWS